MSRTVVIDTNIFVSTLMKADTAPREIFRLCFEGKVQPVIGNALLCEYEDLLTRQDIFARCNLSTDERYDFLCDFTSVCKWISIYYLWRPNLQDEADNHLIELAVAGNADYIITGNIRDFEETDLVFPDIRITTASEFLKERRS